MLALQEEGMIAGIRGVEWDAVELPSQCGHRAFARGWGVEGVGSGRPSLLYSVALGGWPCLLRQRGSMMWGLPFNAKH